MDFMHKQLINAASRDALGSIGMGAGIGAGVGAASSLITGNDSLLGGATSGAMLGAAGGAGMRYAGTKYGAGFAANAGKNTGKFDQTLFSKAEKPFSFMGNSEADQAALTSALKSAPNAGAPGATTVTADAGKVTSEAKKPRMLEQGTNLVEYQQEKQAAIAAKVAKKAAESYTSAPLLRGGVNTGSNRSYAPRGERLDREAVMLDRARKADAVLANRKPTVGMEDVQDRGFMGDVPQHQLQYMNNTFAPKLNNEEIRKGIVAKNASKIQKPGYTSQQEINNQWSNQASEKASQMDDMWSSIGL